MTRTIFITGATGYIGGACLERLLDDKAFEITALVRSEEKAKKLNDLGVAAIIGSIDDAELMISAAADADIVHHNVCFHLLMSVLRSMHR